MKNKDELKTQIAEAQEELEGLIVLQLLQAKYSVRFCFLDPGTGYHYYEVINLISAHRYTVKIKFVRFLTNFFVRKHFSFCPCARFSGEANCPHFLLAIHFEALRSGYKNFDLGKFAKFQLAKSYLKEFEKELATNE